MPYRVPVRGKPPKCSSYLPLLIRPIGVSTMDKLFRFLPWRVLLPALAFCSAYDEMSLCIEKHRVAAGLNAIGMFLWGGFWFLQPAVFSLRVFRLPLQEGVQLLSKQSQQAVVGPLWLRGTIMLSAMLFFSAGVIIRAIQFLG
jgi:hypothetical protein